MSNSFESGRKPVSSENIYLDDDAHWYEVDATGIIHARFDADLRAARAHQETTGIGYFPSPTTIIGAVLAKPELEAYRVSTAMDGTLLVLKDRASVWVPPTRLLGESDDQFAARAVAAFLPPIDDLGFRKEALKRGKEKVVVAQNFGTSVHESLEAFVKFGPKAPVSEAVSPYFEKLACWFEENVAEVCFSERKMFSTLGYAGTSDLGLILKDNRRVIADVKTGNWKFSSKRGLHPYRKFGHPLQLSSYRQCASENLGSEWGNAGGLILHVCSNEPKPVVAEPFTSSEMDVHFDAFNGLLKTWVAKNHYRPKAHNLSRGAIPVSQVEFAAGQARLLESVATSKALDLHVG